MKPHRFLWFSAALLCIVAAFVYASGKARVKPITRTFATGGVKKIILRASQARTAKLRIYRGNILVISTKNEILYIHHYYALTNINVQVPKGIKVIREERKLTGDGTPNLNKPT